MKECPKCKKVFPDDLFYCLDDGTPLASKRMDEVDATAPTEPAYNLGYAAPTEVIHSAGRSAPTEVIPVARRSVETKVAVSAPPHSFSSIRETESRGACPTNTGRI